MKTKSYVKNDTAIEKSQLTQPKIRSNPFLKKKQVLRLQNNVNYEKI